MQEREDQRLLDHPAFLEGVGEEGDMAAALLAKFAPETIAAAFVRQWRAGRSAPEVLSDSLPPPAALPPRERGEFGPSVWFRINVGHTGRAEARWLLPKICEAGAISKDGIGAIRVKQDEAFAQIAAPLAERFGQMVQLDRDLTMTRIEGEPDLAPPARPTRPAREDRPKAAYESRKPPRVVEEDEDAPAPAAQAEAPARKPYAKREDSDRKPYAPREQGDRKPYAPREYGDRKPYAPRADGDRKPYAPREEGDRKPWAKREDGPRKPYAPRDGAERKPYAPREDGDRKPYAKREDGPRKPYAPRDAAEGDRKPRWSPDDRAAKPKYKSEGYKSHGGGEGKPARAAGFKSHKSEGGYDPLSRSEGAENKRVYAPKGDDARPFAKREGGKSAGYKGAKPTDGKKPYVKRDAPAPKPRTDARDTSKRFVPPKRKA